MDFCYVFLDVNNWEDMIIFLSKKYAINESKIFKNTQKSELKFLK